MASSRASSSSASSRTGSNGGLNPEEWKNKIISMSLKKKITLNNCFLVEIDKAVTASAGENNFREVTPVLTAVTEIYEKRVEATHADAVKARSGFAAGAGSDGEDDADTTLDPENAGRRRNARKKNIQDSYIEKNLNNLNMKKNELGQEFDPIFNAMTVGEGGSTPLAAALLSQIRLHPGAILAMDSNDHFGDFEAAQSKQGDSANEELAAGAVRLESEHEQEPHTDNNEEHNRAQDEEQEGQQQGENTDNTRTEGAEEEEQQQQPGEEQEGTEAASNKTVSEQTSRPTAEKPRDEHEDLFRPQRFTDLAYLFPKAVEEFSQESLCQTYAGFQFSGWTSDHPAFLYPPTMEIPAPMPPAPNYIALLPNTTNSNTNDDNEDRFQSEYDLPPGSNSFSFPSSPGAASSTPVGAVGQQFECLGDPNEDVGPTPEFQASPPHFDNDDFDYLGDDAEADNGELFGEVDYNGTIKQFNMLAVNPSLPVMPIPTINLEERGNKWAGPAFWRFFPPSLQSDKKRREMDRANGEGDGEEETGVKTKTRARRAEPFRIDFTKPVDTSSFVRSGNINLSAANLAKANPSDNLLPPDQRYSMRDLLSFFVRPEWRVQELQPVAQTSKTQAPFIKEMSFIEAGAGEQNEVGYHYPTAEEDVGPPDYFDHGDVDDDDDVSHMDMGMALGLDVSSANPSGPTGSYYGINSMPTRQPTDNSTYNMFAPRRLGLTALQSTLNVKKLKSEIWSELSDRLTNPVVPANTQRANHAVDDSENVEEPTEFQGILSSIPDRIDNSEQLSQVSVPFCFICLLHLANEQGLELSQDHKTLSNQLASLSVSRPGY